MSTFDFYQFGFVSTCMKKVLKYRLKKVAGFVASDQL